MANPQLFKSAPRGRTSPPTDTLNQAGGSAYKRSSAEALAQIAATGCFGDTYYADASQQLDDVLQLAAECEPKFVAKTALYARNRGYMKDMPATLLAYLASSGPEGVRYLQTVFPAVIDNGRMLRNFVQMIRSGRFGRKSFGTAPKRLVQAWLIRQHPMALLRASVGNNPSLADIIKMVHPKPKDAAQRAMFAYLIGKVSTIGAVDLPSEVRHFEAWKAGDRSSSLPRVPSRMLEGLKLTRYDWEAIAIRAKWMETRMNLASWWRKGILETDFVRNTVIERLRDPNLVREARAFPYQLMQAWKMCQHLPHAFKDALQDAMHIALENVPSIPGHVVICPDTSGSMTYGQVTGKRNIGRAGNNAATCIEVAGLITAALVKQNPDARVLPFADRLRTSFHLNPRDSIPTLAKQLSSMGGGGTACALPLQHLCSERAKVDAVIYVSDSESWLDSYRNSRPAGTSMLGAWNYLKVLNPQAKLICIDLVPSTTAQVQSREDILQVGGFSDTVFDVIGAFLNQGRKSWVEEIKAIGF